MTNCIPEPKNHKLRSLALIFGILAVLELAALVPPSLILHWQVNELQSEATTASQKLDNIQRNWQLLAVVPPGDERDHLINAGMPEIREVEESYRNIVSLHTHLEKAGARSTYIIKVLQTNQKDLIGSRLAVLKRLWSRL